MGMTIDKAILRIEHSSMSVDDKETADFIIDTMRKYQKIEEAYKKYQNDLFTNIYADKKFVKALEEVLENGNED